MDEQYEIDEQLDLRSLMASALQKLPLIVAVTLVFGLAAFVYSNWFITPIYSTNVKFYVNNQQGVSSSIKVQSADVTTSNTLVHGYVAMLKTDRVLEEVAINTKLGYSASQIGSMISASSVENTPIFVVTVKSADPAHAQKIANVVADIAPSLIQDIVKGSSVEIIDRAKLPTSPVSPDVKKITLIGLLIGFVLCAAVVLVAAKLDIRVKSGDELSSRFDLPVLAVIPKMNVKAADKRLLGKSASQTDEDRLRIIAAEGLDVHEAYNTLRTNLMFSVPKKACRKVVVTSPCEGDGKSTTAVNLAIGVGEKGLKALLVDADLRRPSVARLLGLENGSGLSDVLAGLTDVEKVLRKNVRKNTDVIPSGTLPPNPTELLAGQAFADLLKELEKDYDYIIIDTPPVNLLADAAVALGAADGAVMVASIGRTGMDSVRAAVSALRLADRKILGFAVNGAMENRYGYYSKR